MIKTNINEILEFNPDRSNRISILKDNITDIGLLTYKPTQTTPNHMHKDLDEVFYVISGSGSIIINDEVILITEGDTIYSPIGETHGFNNTSSDDLVVLQIKISA